MQTKIFSLSAVFLSQNLNNTKINLNTKKLNYFQCHSSYMLLFLKFVDILTNLTKNKYDIKKRIFSHASPPQLYFFLLFFCFQLFAKKLKAFQKKNVIWIKKLSKNQHHQKKASFWQKI